MTRTISLPVSDELWESISAAAQESGRDAISVAGEMLSEAAKMRRVPGIVFASEGERRVPKIAGTGLDVWEVVGPYLDMGRDWQRLRAGFDWLSEEQLRAALAYAESFPAEGAEWQAEAAEWSLERTWARYPQTKPPWR